MARVATQCAFVFLALILTLPVPADSRYEKHTSKYRLSQCRERVSEIRDRMRAGMEAIFGQSPPMPVYVTKKLMLNAYADGNAITFSPVICEVFPGDDEFSIIVGHEIAHNLLGHYEEAITGVLAGAAAESIFGGLTGISLGGMGANAGAVAFSKDREREADYYGLYLAAYAGYDISVAPDLWRALAHDSGGGSGGLTHPSSPERAARAMLVVVDVAHKRRDNRSLLPDNPPPVRSRDGQAPATGESERKED